MVYPPIGRLNTKAIDCYAYSDNWTTVIRVFWRSLQEIFGNILYEFWSDIYRRV